MDEKTVEIAQGQTGKAADLTAEEEKVEGTVLRKWTVVIFSIAIVVWIVAQAVLMVTAIS